VIVKALSIALTGDIACGKSTLAESLYAEEYRVIDNLSGGPLFQR